MADTIDKKIVDGLIINPNTPLTVVTDPEGRRRPTPSSPDAAPSKVVPQNTTATPYNIDPTPAVEERPETQYTLIDPGEMPNKDDYGWYDQWVKDLEPPLSPEEKLRRERSAYINSGIINLGNAIGAFGNMLYAQGGAPAQKLPTAEDADKKVSAFREHADKVRNAYINGQVAARKGNIAEYDADMTRYLNAVKANNAAKTAADSYHLKAIKVQLEQEKAALQNELMAARINGENAKAQKILAQIDEINTLLGYKASAWSGLASQRYSAAARNDAQEDYYNTRE